MNMRASYLITATCTVKLMVLVAARLDTSVCVVKKKGIIIASVGDCWDSRTDLA